ncbi:MAG: LemA family protein [Burkholderiales bacterium]
MLTFITIQILLIAIAVVLAAWAILGYNALVRLRNRFVNAFAQIDVQLKRRFDLIPNLVETARGYLKHERETLESVTRARAAAVSASEKAAANPRSAEAIRQLAAEDAGLSGALQRLFALVESYPDLKADKTIASLSEELTSTENKVAFARQAYNDAVLRYNTAIQIFPSNLLAAIFSFREASSFQTERPEERQPVRVSLSA